MHSVPVFYACPPFRNMVYDDDHNNDDDNEEDKDLDEEQRHVW